MKIREACEKAGNQEPEYIIKKDELTVVFVANEAFDASKEVFDNGKGLFEGRKESFQNILKELNGYNTSKENLLRIFEQLCNTEFFGRQEIMSICGINSNNAGKLIDKLKICNAIEPVNGHGKGKFHFVI